MCGRLREWERSDCIELAAKRGMRWREEARERKNKKSRVEGPHGLAEEETSFLKRRPGFWPDPPTVYKSRETGGWCLHGLAEEETSFVKRRSVFVPSRRLFIRAVGLR